MGPRERLTAGHEQGRGAARGHKPDAGAVAIGERSIRLPARPELHDLRRVRDPDRTPAPARDRPEVVRGCVDDPVAVTRSRGSIAAARGPARPRKPAAPPGGRPPEGKEAAAAIPEPERD